MNYQNNLNYLFRNCDEKMFSRAEAAEYGFQGKLHGHKIRMLKNGEIHIGFKDFDRWANSIAVVLHPKGNNIRRDLMTALEVARKEENRRGSFWKRWLDDETHAVVGHTEAVNN